MNQSTSYEFFANMCDIRRTKITIDVDENNKIPYLREPYHLALLFHKVFDRKRTILNLSAYTEFNAAVLIHEPFLHG
jgi:hypothetical protein